MLHDQNKMSSQVRLAFCVNIWRITGISCNFNVDVVENSCLLDIFLKISSRFCQELARNGTNYAWFGLQCACVWGQDFWEPKQFENETGTHENETRTHENETSTHVTIKACLAALRAATSRANIFPNLNATVINHDFDHHLANLIITENLH